MKVILPVLLAAGLGSLSVRAADEVTLDTTKSKVSYGIGFNMGNSIRNYEIEVDDNALLKGLLDSIHQRDALMTPAEITQTLNDFRTEHTRMLEERKKLEATQNREVGQKFLEENQSKEGVVTLPSGLQYRVIQEGQGDSPKATDQVAVNYRGRLIDGTEFDSSYGRGQPTKFYVNRVVKGWTEALQLMKPGSKWELFVPADLAYGDRGTGSGISPGSTLIFEVELVSVEPPQPKAAPKSQPVTSDIIKVPSKEELEKGAQIEIIKKEDIEKEIEKQRQQEAK